MENQTQTTTGQSLQEMAARTAQALSGDLSQAGAQASADVAAWEQTLRQAGLGELAQQLEALPATLQAGDEGAIRLTLQNLARAAEPHAQNAKEAGVDLTPLLSALQKAGGQTAQQEVAQGAAQPPAQTGGPQGQDPTALPDGAQGTRDAQATNTTTLTQEDMQRDGSASGPYN